MKPLENHKMRFIKILFLIIVFVSIFLLGLNNHGLWTPDEPRVAEIGREMAERGNFFIPELNKRPFLEQPPLYYASMAILFRLAGKAEESLARLPSAIYGMAGVFATFLLGYTLFGMTTGIISAFIISTSFEYFRVSHWAIVDSALSCFIFFAMFFFIKGYSIGDKRKKSLHYLLFYVFCTLAFFVKGFIGIGIPAVAVLSFLILDKNIKEITKMQLWIGLLLFLISLFLWAICLYNYGGMEYIRVFFIDNNLLRFLPGGKSGHHRPFYYYFTEFPAGFMPWSIFLIPTFFYVFSKNAHHDRKGLLFLLCWFISGFVLFSLSATKRILYLLPLFAPISILTSAFIEYIINSWPVKGLYRIFLWIYGFMYLLMGIMFLPMVKYISKIYPIALDSKEFVFSIIISICLIVLSLICLKKLLQHKIKQYFYLVGGCLYGILLFALLIGTPFVDQYKNFKPFAEKIINYIPKDSSIYAYKPDETIRGFIPFYTKRYLEEIHDRTGLFSLMEKKETVYIVIRDKDNKLKKELLNEGFIEVMDFTKGSESSLSLFKR